MYTFFSVSMSTVYYSDVCNNINKHYRTVLNLNTFVFFPDNHTKLYCLLFSFNGWAVVVHCGLSGSWNYAVFILFPSYLPWDRSETRIHGESGYSLVLMKTPWDMVLLSQK